MRPKLQVFLATDADTAGANLAAELSRRLKRHRCKITAWPAGWQDHLLYLDMDVASQRLRDYEAVRSRLSPDSQMVLVRSARSALQASRACTLRALGILRKRT